MDAVDEYIPDPERDVDKPFLMPIEDVFSITGRGTVVTGRSSVARARSARRSRSWVFVPREDDRHGCRDVPQAAGRGPGRRQRRLACCGARSGRRGARPGAGAPGSITPHTKFKGEVYVLGKDEGGRHTPFFTDYRPQFYFRTTDVTGIVDLPEGTEMVMPGDNVT